MYFSWLAVVIQFQVIFVVGNPAGTGFAVYGSEHSIRRRCFCAEREERGHRAGRGKRNDCGRRRAASYGAATRQAHRRSTARSAARPGRRRSRVPDREHPDRARVWPSGAGKVFHDAMTCYSTMALNERRVAWACSKTVWPNSRRKPSCSPSRIKAGRLRETDYVPVLLPGAPCPVAIADD